MVSSQQDNAFQNSLNRELKQSIYELESIIRTVRGDIAKTNKRIDTLEEFLNIELDTKPRYKDK